MIKGNFVPKTDINEYLEMDDDFITSIYENVKADPKYMKIFDPLTVLNLIYEQLEIIELNINEPISLTNHLFNLQLHKNKELNKHVLLYFIEYLIGLSMTKKLHTDSEKNFDDVFPFFYFFITDFLDKKIELLYPDVPINRPNPDKTLFKFNTIKRELRYFQNISEKINYLIEVKTIFQQKYPNIKDLIETPLMDSDFAEKCDLEIQKLKSLIEIEPKEIPLIEPQKELSEADVLNIKNNFDNVNILEVYNHFKKGLVEKKYLSENELIAYLMLAFEKLELPKEKFKFKHTPTKVKIAIIFYEYYKEIAGKPLRKQNKYAALLSEYFEGYNNKNVCSNFSKI